MKIKLWPALIIGLLAVFMTADIVLVVLAFRTQDEVVASYTHSNDR